jgi:ketosteroid isomerase-like protein
MNYATLVVSALAVALSANVSAKALEAQDASATEVVNTLSSSMLKALDNGTPDALSTYYTKDAIVRGVSGDNAYGLQEIAEYWTMAGSHTTYNVRNEQASINGNTLTQIGTWSAEHTVDGMRGVGGGNLVRVLIKQPDGSWKIAYEAWN